MSLGPVGARYCRVTAIPSAPALDSSTVDQMRRPPETQIHEAHVATNADGDTTCRSDERGPSRSGVRGHSVGSPNLEAS